MSGIIEIASLILSFLGLVLTCFYNANLKKKHMKEFRFLMCLGAIILAAIFVFQATIKVSLIACACSFIWIIIGFLCAL